MISSHRHLRRCATGFVLRRHITVPVSLKGCRSQISLCPTRLDTDEDIFPGRGSDSSEFGNPDDSERGVFIHPPDVPSTSWFETPTFLGLGTGRNLRPGTSAPVSIGRTNFVLNRLVRYTARSRYQKWSPRKDWYVEIGTPNSVSELKGTRNQRRRTIVSLIVSLPVYVIVYILWIATRTTNWRYLQSSIKWHCIYDIRKTTHNFYDSTSYVWTYLVRRFNKIQT